MGYAALFRRRGKRSETRGAGEGLERIKWWQSLRAVNHKHI